MTSTKIYFASDFHLGVPDRLSSLDREKKLVRWLQHIQQDAAQIYLVGDIFDFWFEYKHAVPKGFTRLLGTLSQLSDIGIQIHLFTGNHDMWMFDYLEQECGVTIHRHPIECDFGGKNFLIGHGDGLGPGDYGYKILKSIFANRLCQWLFARLHPNFGIALASSLSRYSRSTTGHKDQIFLGENKEWLILWCKEQLMREHFDYFIFGHRHYPIQIDLLANSSYINLGEWFSDTHYAVFDGITCQLLKYKN